MKEQQGKAEEEDAEERANIVEKEEWKRVTVRNKRRRLKTAFRFLMRSLGDSKQTKSKRRPLKRGTEAPLGRSTDPIPYKKRKRRVVGHS